LNCPPILSNSSAIWRALRFVVPLNAQRAFTDFPDMRLTIDDLVGEGNKVVVRWTCRATHSRSGKSLAWTGVSCMRLVDGKVVEDWVLSDLLGLQQQLADVDAARADATAEPGLH